MIDGVRISPGLPIRGTGSKQYDQLLHPLRVFFICLSFEARILGFCCRSEDMSPRSESRSFLVGVGCTAFIKVSKRV